MRTLVMMNPIGVFGLVSGELSVLGCHYHFKDCIAKSVCLVCTQPVCICISQMQLHDDDAMQE
ncbi:hypothetical protein Prudu_004092 [Prunus dulcis]|uniref:Uncharacterized protein n=1 Tax=Prunus dulcis TaxID=3755 RepID=A0A4Y1QUI4_PRUDU|nr:hypothetical protein Prudu_004092 [Prunus dulcis]